MILRVAWRVRCAGWTGAAAGEVVEGGTAAGMMAAVVAGRLVRLGGRCRCSDLGAGFRCRGGARRLFDGEVHVGLVRVGGGGKDLGL